MKRLLSAVGGLTAVAILSAVLLAQSQSRSDAQQPTPFVNKPDIVFSDNPEQAAIDELVFSGAAEEVQRAAYGSIAESSSMREEFVRLLGRKAELMKDEELADAYYQLQTEVLELEAGRKLEAISAELQALVESHPDTAAARRAEQMLNPPIPVEDVYSEAEAVTEEAPAPVALEAGPQTIVQPLEEEAIPAAAVIDPNQPSFIEFGEVVVNLDEARLSRYLDVRVTLQVPHARHDEVSTRVAAEQAILQNWLLGHLSTQTMDSVRGAAGQDRLRTEIKDYFNTELFGEGDPAIEDVLFQKFAVQ